MPKTKLKQIVTTTVLAAAALGVSTTIANAQLWDIALPGTSVRAWSTKGECQQITGWSCVTIDGGVCGYKPFMTQSSFDIMYNAVIKKGQTAVLNEIVDGYFGDRLCEFSK